MSCQFSFPMRVKQGLESRIRQAVWCRVSTVHLTEGLCVCDLWMFESAVVFLSLCVFMLVLDAVSSGHDPVGSNQRSPTSVPPLTVPLILQRDLETRKRTT